MGYLSYLPDFKNLTNLKEELKLYNEQDNQFEVLLFRSGGQHVRGIISLQEGPDCLVIRYVSLDPGFRNNQTRQEMMTELKQLYPKENITVFPSYTFLLPFLRRGNTVE
ncbi:MULTISPECIES: reductase [unclassified Lactobacillus]|uniref:reductase n=1 Tax=unclassified Lactobacillus TaxID=2620435 RepID=UPI00223FC185|nr:MULTISPECIES: reductase [unclassified Lactobacillus]